MANNKTTYTLQIDAEINSLEKKLGSIQNLMQNVMNSADAPKGLEKSFEKIGSLIDKIRTKASAPIDSKSGFTSIGKDIEAVNIALGSLYKMIGSVGEMSEASRISFLPPEAQKEIVTIIKSIESYQAAIASATTETAELIEARRELAKAETAKSKADADLELKQQSLDRAKQEQKNAQAAIDAINERKAALDDLLKKQEEIEKFYNTEGADGKKPNRSKKYDGVSMRPQDIKRQIKSQEALMIGDAEELEKQQAAYKNAADSIIRYNKQVNTANDHVKDAEAAIASATRVVEELNTAFESGSTEKKQAAYAALKAEADKLGIKVSDLNDEFSETDANTLTQRLIELKQRGLKPVTDAMDRAQAETREMGNTAKQAGKDVKESAEAYKEMNDAAAQQDAFENKIKSFLGVAGAAQVMRHALRDAMQTITELDKTMTEMSVVTDLKVSDYWDQLPQYTQRANELGLAINDVYKADTLYYQQGLKTNEVVAISTETMKMARIAGLDTAEATDRMTAALRGFNMELNETSAAKIADVYSELAAITAADVDEISTAMTKTASIASSAGMEFETTAAFLSQIIETTRESAETAGTAMKTVIARFQELKKAPEDIGEVDGEIVDANAIETALRSVGVELRDAGGQFRELDDVFLELSKKWNTLDKNTQRYIATIAAGSRQQSRFIAMMSDYKRTQDLVTAANNSAGASNRQFEKTMDSLESKIEKLKNTWHEFTMGIMNSDLVKAGVDILTKFLQIINSITSAFDGVGGSLAKIGSVLAIFKLGKALFEKFKPMIGTFLMSIVDDYKKAGENAGGQFASGVKKGVQKAEGEDNQTGTIDQKPKEEEQRKPGSIERVAGNTLKGKISNVGIGLMESVGVGHFADAMQAGQNKRDARDNIVANKHLIESTLGGKEGINQRIAEGQGALDQLDKDYLFEGDKVYKKGPRGGKKQLTKKQASKVKADKGEADRKITEATEELKEYEAAEKSIKKSEADLAANSKKQWESISSGLESASMAAAGVGMAFGAIGQAFTDAGLEEVGGVISVIGTAFMVLSTVMQIASSILPLLQTGFGAAGAAGATSGKATTAAWGAAGLIVMAVMASIIAVVAIVLLVVNAIKNASPEKKLEDMQNAAANAAQAADEAAESYDKLVDSLDGLEGQYKKLEELVRGTKEWNAAVREINSSVLDLISSYPELAQFVENKEGVLTIDINSDEVQGILQEAENKKIVTGNQSVLANAEVAKAQNNVNFGQLQGIKDVANLRGWEGAETASNPIEAGIKTYELAGGGFGGVMAGIGTGLLSAITIVGQAGTAAINGSISSAQTASDEKLQKAVAKLSDAVATNEISSNREDMYQKLLELGVARDEATLLADSFAKDVDSLINYGQTIEAADKQQQAAFDSIAASAQGLANTMTMTGEQIQQSSVLIDGEISEKLYNEKLKQLEGIELKDLNDNAEVMAAVRETYGAGATMDNNGNITYQKDGKNETVTLTKEQITSMVATKYATENTATAIEYSDDAISAVAGVIGKEAINNLYLTSEGGSLTKENADTIQKALGTDFDAKAWMEKSETEKDNYTPSKTILEAWEAMSDNAKLAYGNDITMFIDDLAEGVAIANGAFEEAGDAVRSFMTVDMAKAFDKKLDQVASLAGGEEARDQVVKATDILLGAVVDAAGNVQRDEEGNVKYKNGEGELTDDQRKAIQNRIDMTDWSSQEQLIALQIELQNQYGFTAEEAQEYINVLGKASYATSELTTVVQTYDELWKATERINQSLKRVTKLQYEYEKALSQGTGSLKGTIDQLIKEYQLQGEQHKVGYDNSISNLEKIYAQGGTNFKVDLRNAVKIGKDGIDVDSMELQKYINGKQITQEEADAWIKDLNKWYESADKHYEGMIKSVKSIEELEEQSRDSYYELRDMAKDAILNQLQKQIDLQQQTLEATQEANEALINKIQEQINDTRQARENDKAEKNLENLRNQQAYLSMDTSGANALQLLDLETQIQEAEQNYQDSLVDQALQKLSDSNEQAAEQRARQIEIAQKQLDAYSLSNAFQQNVDAQLGAMIAANTEWQTTGLGQLLKGQLSGMSEEEVAVWTKGITGKVESANRWLSTNWDTAINPLNTNIKNIDDNIATLPEKIATGASSLAVKDMGSLLARKGLSGMLAKNNITVSQNEDGTVSVKGSGENGEVTSADEAFMRSLANASNIEGTDADISKVQKELDDKISLGNRVSTEEGQKFNYLSKEEFYNKATFDPMNQTFSYEGELYNSYFDYLTRKNSKDVSGITGLNPREAFGGIAVPGSYDGIIDMWGQAQWKTGEHFDATVDGKTDTLVELGGEVKNEARKQRLDHIWEKTGNGSSPYVVLDENASGQGEPMLFIRQGAGVWRYVRDEGASDSFGNNRPVGLISQAMNFLESKKGARNYTKYGFKTGGLADFTGPAWLDGTPSKPEYILNAAQTERFFSLIDVLESLDDKGKGDKTSGDNYFEIEINVEKLESDYDVEKIANKIRSMIYEDASYRNVNTINLIR